MVCDRILPLLAFLAKISLRNVREAAKDRQLGGGGKGEEAKEGKSSLEEVGWDAQMYAQSGMHTVNCTK